MVQISNDTVLDCTNNALGYSLPRCYGSKANDPYQTWCKVRKRYLTREDANAQVTRIQDGENIHCVLYAISDINVGEEILWNYLFAPESDEELSTTSMEEVTEPVYKRAKVGSESLVNQDGSDRDSEPDDLLIAKQKMVAGQVDLNTSNKAELYLTEISSRHNLFIIT